MDKEKRKEYDKAYREANKEKIKAYREANKEKAKAYKKAYREANKEKILEQAKAYREANKEKITDYLKVYREANKEKNANQQRAYREANKEKILEQAKIYREANKDKIWAYKKNRLKNDPLFKLVKNFRRSCARAFDSINQQKNVNSLKLLGLKTWQQFAKHLSKQFYDHPETGEEMTFDNHGFYVWHIDHIIPLFTAKNEEDVIKLCHYTNLQPLWLKDHIAKTASDYKKYKILDEQ